MSDPRVHDRTDPTGMFSKAGRVAAEMHNILLNGNDILENRRKYHKVSSVSIKQYNDPTVEIVSKRIQNELLKNIPNLLDDEKPQSESQQNGEIYQKRKKLSHQPFSVITSREKRENVMGVKKVASTGAIYKPKYSVIEKKDIQNIDFKKILPRKETFVKKPEYLDNVSSLLDDHNVTLERISSKAKGLTPLDKQTYRIDPLTQAFKNKQYTEDNFTPVEWPKNYSGTTKTMSVDLRKLPSRKDLYTLPETANCSDYEPNYDYPLKRANQYDKLMGVASGRKFEDKRPYYTNEQTYDFDEYVKKNKSVIFPAIKSPKFEKMAPREKDPYSKLPGYLQSFSRISNASVSGIASPHRQSSDLRSYVSGPSLENSLYMGSRSVKS